MITLYASNLTPEYLKGYSEVVARFMERGHDCRAYDFSVRYFRTLGMKFEDAQKYIPEEIILPAQDMFHIGTLIDAEKGTMFEALPEIEPRWNIDEAYPPLKKLPQ